MVPVFGLLYHPSLRTLMRPLVAVRSHFRFPLDFAFGSPSGVRILRALAQQERPFGTTELAAQTKLNESGVRRTLKALIAEGLVETSGGQRGATYRIAAGHPLRAGLDALFVAEAQRMSRVLDAVRSAAKSIVPPVDAVWLYGSVARGNDQPGSDMDLAIVVADEHAVDPAVDTLRSALTTTEELERVDISVLGLSRADVLRLADGDPWWTAARAEAVPLVGAAPDVLRQRFAAAAARQTTRVDGRRA